MAMIPVYDAAVEHPGASGSNNRGQESVVGVG